MTIDNTTNTPESTGPQNTSAPPKLEVRRFESCNGREGRAFSYELWVDGALAAYVRDEGCGGCTDADWTPSGGRRWEGPVQARLEAYAATLPPLPPLPGCEKFGPLDMTLELLLGMLADDEDERRRILRLCAGGKKTVYRAPSMPQGEWMIMKRAFDATTRSAIVAKHPDAIFANETVRRTK